MDTVRRDLLKLSPLALATLGPACLTRASAEAQGVAGQNGPTRIPRVFDVRTYGTAGDGTKIDSIGINKAIEAAAASGGGTVWLTAGTYLCFSIRMRSNVELYLAQGAVLLAAESPKPGETSGQLGGTYDPAEPNVVSGVNVEGYQDYGHNHWHNSLIWGENLHDIGIRGPGLIYGKGLSFGGGARSAARGAYTVYVAEQPGVGNKAIALKNCRNVTLADFSILKGGHFGLLLTGVDNLVISQLTIDTDRDGMDIDCCKNVHVSDCTVNSPWDDGICPKSSFALGYPKATENVTITNCLVSGCYELGTVLDATYKLFPADAPGVGRTGRIKCGTESNGGFKNITISNCVFDGCNGLALESEDGALCEDIAISNITLRNVINGPLFFRLGSRLRGPKATTRVGTLRRILVSNIVSSNSLSIHPNILSGIPDYPLEDIKIDGFYMQHQGGGDAAMAAISPPEKAEAYPDPGMFGPMPAQGFFLRHIRNLEMSHVEVAPMKPDARPSFYLEDVNRVDFFAITAPRNPAFALHRVRDLRLHWSRAAADAALAEADDRQL